MEQQLSSGQIKIVWFLLRFGVAFTFLFASVSAFLDPTAWLNYFPQFLRTLFSDTTLLILWGGAEVVIGLWILIGYKIFLPSIAAAGLMFGIFLFDFASIHIIFRNVCILATSIALAIISNPHYEFHLYHGKESAEESHKEIGLS